MKNMWVFIWKIEIFFVYLQRNFNTKSMINKKREKVVDYILHHREFVEIHNEYMRLWKDKQPKEWIAEQTICSIHSDTWCDAIYYAGYKSISIDDVQDFKPNFLKVMDSVENEIKKYLLTI